MARIRKAAAIRRRLQLSSRPDQRAGKLSPELFSIDLPRMFRRVAPLEVEIGSGAGDFILVRAAAAPARNFIAIELASLLHRMVEAKAARAELNNLCVLSADARSVVNLFLPNRSVACFHVYFPDPWPKKRHAKHRLFSPVFVAGLRRTLCADGTVLIASDVSGYAQTIFELMEQGGFTRAQSALDVSALTRFDNDVLPSFGLPRSLPG